MRKFLFTFLLFVSPFIIWLFINFFFVPADLFAFRSWEALQPKLFFSYFSGPFYPNMKLQKVEVGDLAPHTALAVDKEVFWQTDRYGYRTSDDSEDYDIVIVGDSNTVGTGLTQADTPAAVLARLSGRHVYPYATADISRFLGEERFQKHKPQVVILSSIERSLTGLCADIRIAEKAPKNSLSYISKIIGSNRPVDTLVSRLDRSLAPGNFKHLYYKLTRTVPPPLYTYMSGKMLFLQGTTANRDLSAGEINKIADNIENCNKLLAARDIRMIFLPIPNKENIYYRLLPEQKKPTLLKNLLAELAARGMEVVNLETPFLAAHEREGTALYHTDDTHWNAMGVKLAAEKLADYLESDLRVSL